MNQIYLRPIRFSDGALIHAWRNDPVTRRNSFVTRYIPMKEHAEWFQKAISRRSMTWYVAIDGHKALIGHVRFERYAKRAFLMSMTVAPKYRGCGFAQTILSQSLQRHQHKSPGCLYRAEIKRSNKISIRLFEHGGFRIKECLADRNAYTYDAKDAHPRWGVKIWSTNRTSFTALKSFYEKKILDYIELYVVPGSFQKRTLAALKNIPVVLHAPTEKHGFNPYCYNAAFRRALSTLCQFQDYFQENRLIVHPGTRESYLDTNVWQRWIQVLLRIQKKGFQLMIENLPLKGFDGTALAGTHPKEIQRLMETVNCQFCLDLGHAVYAASSYRKPPLKVIRDFLRLNPRILHLSDGWVRRHTDIHLPFGQGDFPLRQIVRLIQEHGQTHFLSIETPKKDFETLREDQQNLRVLKKMFRECLKPHDPL